MIKVLMMGGRRCGKTSVLASLFNESIHGKVKDYLTLSDDTKPEVKDGEEKEPLSTKTLELRKFLEDNSTGIFLVDRGPTNHFWNYLLKVRLPGKSSPIEIEFRDSNGEFFVAGNKFAPEISKYVEQCDIYIIVIDTPYLMGPIDGGCRDSVCDGVNCVESITNFLTNIDDKEDQDSKMVLFVPIKCERWVKDGVINKVTERIKKVYNTAITHLSKYKKMEIGIIPIQTAGNIQFVELKPAFLYTNQFDNRTTKCCKIGNKFVRLENGDMEDIKPGDIVNPDPRAIIDGTDISKPYAWYNITPGDNNYAPHNCDQIPLHILRFVLKKTRDLEASFAQMNRLERLLYRLREKLNHLRQIWTGTPIDEVEKILHRMQRDGVIIDSGEGIEYIKRCY